MLECIRALCHFPTQAVKKARDRAWRKRKGKVENIKTKNPCKKVRKKSLARQVKNSLELVTSNDLRSPFFFSK